MPARSGQSRASRRRSILLHLRVPGGKWQTRMVSRRSSANFCSSTFHSRDLDGVAGRTTVAGQRGQHLKQPAGGLVLVGHRIDRNWATTADACGA